MGGDRGAIDIPADVDRVVVGVWQCGAEESFQQPTVIGALACRTLSSAERISLSVAQIQAATRARMQQGN